MILGSKKSIKHLFDELEFHHSHNYYIKNNNLYHRIKRDMKYIYPTKSSNEFDYKDKIEYRNVDLNSIKSQLINYFGL
jgi:hypothetical protein